MKKALVFSLLVLALSGSGASAPFQETVSPASPSRSSQSRPSLPVSPLERLAGKIMAYHERKTGVHYDAVTPPIKLDTEMSYRDMAYYHKGEKTIYLHPRHGSVDLDNLLTNLDTPKLSDDERELREVLSHELAHYLTDVYVQKHVPHSWLARPFHKDFSFGPKHLDALMVIEGIAEYFGHLFDSGPGVTFPSEKWDEGFDNMGSSSSVIRWLTYQGGRDITRQILEKDTHKGLLWLLENELVVKAEDENFDFSSVSRYKKEGLAWVVKK